VSNTDPTDFQSQIDALGAQILASGGTTTTNELLPTPIGVPKYQVTETGEIAKYPAGTKGPNGEDLGGQPVPWSATVPEGRQVASPFGVTGRIEPGSPAAEAGRQVRPKYWSHDAWTLVDGLSAEDVYGVQRQLIDSGLLKAKGVVAGNWTNQEAGAFQQVLSLANQSGVTWDVALAHMAANGRANPPEQTKVQRPQVEIHKANPFALGQVADKLSSQLIGRRLTDAERNGFVQWWGQHEDAANAEKVRAANAEQNDTMNATGDPANPDSPLNRQTSRSAGPPDLKPQVNVGVQTLHDEMTPDQAAEQYIREQRPQEVSQTQQIDTFEKFLNALGTHMGGGVPGRPGG
jgi:hypothetical protein